MRIKLSEPFQSLVLVLTLLAATWILYLRTLGYEFVSYDDYVILRNNPDLYLWQSWKVIPWAFKTFRLGDWQPLTWFSWLLDYRLFGLDAGAFHRTNVIIHSMNVILLFIIGIQLTRKASLAFLAALMFAIHPQHVESVAWIAERKDVLSGFFWFAAMASYIRYAQSGLVKKWLRWSLLFFALGIMSKPTLVTFPLCMILLDLYILKRKEPLRNLVWEKAVFFLIILFSCVMTVSAVSSPGNEAIESLEAFPISQRIINTFAALSLYLYKTVFPHDLYFYYPYFRDLSIWKTVLSVLSVLAAVFAAFALRKKTEAFLFAMGWFLITLFPVSGLVIQVGSQAMADRYMYFSHIGLFLGAVIGFGSLARLNKPDRWMIRIGASLLLPLWFFFAWFQVATWKNSETLYQHSLNHNPENFHVQEALCGHYHDQGQFDRAKKHCEKALEINANRGIVYWSLGRVALKRNRFETAEEYFKTYFEILLPQRDPENAQIEQVIASTHKKLKGLIEGIKKEPHNPQKRLDMGNFWVEYNLELLAIDSYRAAIRLDSDFVDAWINLANLFFLKGKFSRAETFYEKAMKLHPDYDRLHYNYALFLVQRKKLEKARFHLDQIDDESTASVSMRKQLSEYLKANGYE